MASPVLSWLDDYFGPAIIKLGSVFFPKRAVLEFAGDVSVVDNDTTKTTVVTIGAGGGGGGGDGTHTGDVIDATGEGADGGDQKVVGILGYPITGDGPVDGGVPTFRAEQQDWIIQEHGGGTPDLPTGIEDDILGLGPGGVGFKNLGQGAQVPAGTVGNLVVIGTGGTLADGGAVPTGTFSANGDLDGDGTSQTVVGIQNNAFVAPPDNGIETPQLAVYKHFNEPPEGIPADAIYWLTPTALGLGGGGGTGTPGALGVYDEEGDLGEVTGLKVATDDGYASPALLLPVPQKPFSDFTPMRWAAKVVTVDAGSAPFEPSSGQFGFGRLIVVNVESLNPKDYIWYGFDTIECMALVTVLGPTDSSVRFLHAPGASAGATILSGETSWIAFNGTRIVRVGGGDADLAHDPPPVDGGITMVDPATLNLTGYWGAGFSGSPLAGMASAGSSGSHNATASSNVPSVGTLNGLPIMVCDGVNDHLDPAGSLAAYIEEHGQCAGFILFNADTSVPDSGSGIGDPAFMSEAAGAWSIFFNSSGFCMFMQTAGGPKIAAIPCTTGGWHLGTFSFDGTTLKVGLDGPPSVSISAPGSNSVDASGRTPKLLRNYNDTAFFDGSVARIGITDSAANITADDFDGIVAFYNDQFALSMG